MNKTTIKIYERINKRKLANVLKSIDKFHRIVTYRNRMNSYFYNQLVSEADRLVTSIYKNV